MTKFNKEKIIKIVTVALPIVLIAALAVALIMAFKLSNELSARPVYNDLGDSATSAPPPAVSDPEDEEKPVEAYFTKGLEYVSVGKGMCELSGLGDASDTYIIVPKINEDGDVVVGVADGAFKNNTKLKGIEFPNSVTRIGAYAFYGSSLKEIAIGADVEDIGSYAFTACRSIENIRVDEGNENYSSLNGVLYNKSKSKLITYPAGRGENFCVIPKDVERIENMAFYFCSSIKKVTYHGTETQWRIIDIGAGNDVIEEALLYCTGSEGK